MMKLNNRQYRIIRGVLVSPLLVPALVIWPLVWLIGWCVDGRDETIPFWPPYNLKSGEPRK